MEGHLKMTPKQPLFCSKDSKKHISKFKYFPNPIFWFTSEISFLVLPEQLNMYLLNLQNVNKL